MFSNHHPPSSAYAPVLLAHQPPPMAFHHHAAQHYVPAMYASPVRVADAHPARPPHHHHSHHHGHRHHNHNHHSHSHTQPQQQRPRAMSMTEAPSSAVVESTSPAAAPSESESTASCTSSTPSEKLPHWFSKKQSAKYKTEMCRSVLATGFCKFGSACSFAHDPAELRTAQLPAKFKTTPCNFFWRDGACYFGDRCYFCHATTGNGERVDPEPSIFRRRLADGRTRLAVFEQLTEDCDDNVDEEDEQLMQYPADELQLDEDAPALRSDDVDSMASSVALCQSGSVSPTSLEHISASSSLTASPTSVTPSSMMVSAAAAAQAVQDQEQQQRAASDLVRDALKKRKRELEEIRQARRGCHGRSKATPALAAAAATEQQRFA